MINSDLLTPFGRLIRSARLQRDLTIAKASQEMGITANKLAHYESGHRIPGRQRSMVIAKFYGIPLEEFFGKMDEEEKVK